MKHEILNTLEFKKLVDTVKEARTTFKSWRLGQTYFNVLVKLHPRFEYIRATRFDPFYDDEILIPLFEKILSTNAYGYWKTTSDYALVAPKEVPVKSEDKPSLGKRLMSPKFNPDNEWLASDVRRRFAELVDLLNEELRKMRERDAKEPKEDDNLDLIQFVTFTNAMSHLTDAQTNFVKLLKCS